MIFKSSRLIASILAGCCLLPADSPPPIACNLKALTPDQRQQLSATGRHVISGITDSRELKDGYALHIDSAKVPIADVARWLDLWRRCCPFYEFRIDFRAADANLWLSVTGRPGVKQYIPIDVPSLASKLPK